LERPLVALHNTLDPVVPFQHEVVYANLAAQAGNGNLFTAVPVERYGHCNFNVQEVGAAFALLVQQASAQAGP